MQISASPNLVKTDNVNNRVSSSYARKPFVAFNGGLGKDVFKKVCSNERIDAGGVLVSSLDGFFDSIIGSDKNKYKDGVKSIIVQHLVPNTFPFLKYVHEVFPIDTVVGIPYSANKDVIKKIESIGIKVVVPQSYNDIDKIVLNRLNSLNKEAPEQKVVLQEIGGYLADSIKKINKIGNVAGIVEDTEAGHRRYLKADNKSLPIVSVARSSMKSIEDALVGRSVVFSLERILRESFNDSLDGKKALVLGYGKIGQSAANALRDRHASTVVYDSSALMGIKAKLDGFVGFGLEKMIKEADIIVGTTGNTSMDGKLLKLVKDGAYICSGSSRDVEFDMKAVKKMTSKVVNNEDKTPIRICKNSKGAEFYFLNDGFPVNFKDNSIQDKTIYAVFSELFYSMKKIADNDVVKGLQANTQDELSMLADKYQKAYS